jgi:tripartite-type tricarboxylate transporter receptor subunit TctC
MRLLEPIMKSILKLAPMMTGLALLGTGGAAHAAGPWHCSTIRILVPYAAGGGTDVVARLVASKLTEQLHTTAIVDNRPGGKSVIAYQALLHEPADGCTLLLDNSSHTIQASYRNLPYDPATAFRPVSLVALGPTLLALNPSVPAHDLASFVTYAKSNRVTYGSYGVGTQSHLDGVALGAAAGVSLVHVPYRGSAPALNDLLGNHVQALFVDGLAARPLIKAGKIHPIAAVGQHRWQAFPDLPTFGELGFADLSSPGWWGVFVPAGTPPSIVGDIATTLQRIDAQPDTKTKMADIGAEAFANTPDQFAAEVRTESARWKQIIATRHIEIE